jgi:glycosyltransferase involved in cell wall biosynthesis
VWHQKLSDDGLRDLICSSKVLLLPMNDSGANTAIVESLACGTPIVTTDVGGIRDYGGGTVFPVVANNDDDAMVALMEKYLDGAGWRNEIGARGREFAVNALAWQIIAQQHLEAYETLAR